MRTIRYGDSPDQEADLYLPPKPRPAVVWLLHGGFWKMPYGREQMHEVARDLASRGLAVWNVGYRRVGSGDAGWPATMEDAASGIDHLARLAADGVDLDLDRVVVVGHSAGGHLALWSAGRRRREGSGDRAPTLRAAARAGDRIELIELVGTGHMEYLDPTSEAHATLRRRVLASVGEDLDPATGP